MALLSGIVLLGALAVPLLLVAAVIRGLLRARAERAARKHDLESFD
ncbi:MAG: hypothetical protein ACKOPE_07565 [Novosphingobium sp.]